MSSSPRRLDIREILSDPERRRRLMVAGIQTDQRREGIDTTPEQAERAYRIVTERESAAFFKLKPLRGNPDRRHAGFVAALSDGDGVRFDVARRDFEAIEGKPLAYEELGLVADIFREHPALEPAHGRAAQGLATADDERFVRQWWEVPEGARKWVPFAKGGEYSRFYSAVELVLRWTSGSRIELAKRGRVQNVDLYFRPGLTWPLRTQRGFNVRMLPEGCIFGHKGPTIFAESDETTAFLLGVVNSTLCEYLMRALTSFGSWEVGAVKRLPVPSPPPELQAAIGEVALALHDRKRSWDQGNETSTVFTVPWVLDEEWVAGTASLSERLDAVLAAEAAAEGKLQSDYKDLNDMVFAVYRIDGDRRRAIEESRRDAPPEVLWPQMEGRDADQKRMEHVWRLLSFVVRRVVNADVDGIVPFQPCAGETALLERVLVELAALFPGRDPNQLETEVANELGRSVKGYRRVRGGIQEWLESAFFEYHASLYRRRPIIWHVSGAQGTAPAAFGALVHYHRFDRDRLAKLRGTYLRDATETYRREAALADRAQDAEGRLEWLERLEQSERLDGRLAAVQEGRIDGEVGDLRILTPWKSPEERPHGWSPDLDDGVKVNVAPLDRAGILRVGGIA